MTAKYLIAATVLAILAAAALASNIELYCESRHNDGAGAPVIQTHLWVRFSEHKRNHVMELQGPVFKRTRLVVDESPTEFRALKLAGDKSIEHQVILNRQTLSLNYSVRTSRGINHEFSGTCTRYSPKI